MEADGGLARARAALDDERRLRRARDQLVLVGLDRRDDVAHPRVARPLELLEQKVVHRRRVGERAVERLVADVEQCPPARAEAAPEGDAVRGDRCGRVERPRRRRLPVDDERAARVVVNPAAPHVERVACPLGVDTTEAEPLLGILEGAQAACRPALDRFGPDLRRPRLRGAQKRLAHPVEIVVGAVEVRLLGGQVRVGHVPESSPCV